MFFQSTFFLLLISFFSLNTSCSAEDLLTTNSEISTPEISADENDSENDTHPFQVNSALTLIYGTHGAKGDRRPSMEDTHYPPNAHISQLGEFGSLIADGIHFFGLYDGHGGKGAAEYAQARLHRILVETESFHAGNYMNALTDAYQKTHEEYIADQRNNAGTTAVTILFAGPELWVANAGDSEAVLYFENQAARCITQIHSPADKNECIRIMRLPNSAVRIFRQQNTTTYQSVVKDNGELLLYKEDTRTPKNHQEALTYNFLDRYSLNGDEKYIQKFHITGKIILQDSSYLAVSRGLGDKRYVPFVTPIPFVQNLQLDQPGFLILGCDGLWDVMNYQAAVNFVIREMNLKNLTLQTITHDDAKEIAAKLVYKALEICDHDNVTATLIFFTPKL